LKPGGPHLPNAKKKRGKKVGLGKKKKVCGKVRGKNPPSGVTPRKRPFKALGPSPTTTPKEGFGIEKGFSWRGNQNQ